MERGTAHWPWAQDRGPVKLLARLGLVLCDCAAHVEAESLEKAARCLACVEALVAAAGDGPLQRLAVLMADCLARRLLRPVPAIAGALIDPSVHLDRRSVRAARRSFFDLSPFLKAAVAVGNRAVVEAMDNEKNVHVIEFASQAAQPRQWVELLHDFRRRPEGPPHLRLTVVHDDSELLAKMSELLADEADELDMAFQFHGVAAQLETLDFNDLHGILGLKSGEARAIICTLQLHRLLAVADDTVGSFGAAHHLNQMASIARLQLMATGSLRPSSGSGSNSSVALEDDPYNSPATPLSFVSPPASTPMLQTPPPLASFLSAARALSPKIVVLTEQDANHGGVSFRKRFAEALHHYAAVYGSLDAAAAARRRPRAELAEVERVVLGEEVRDVLLREGARRRERHDRLPQWAARMERAGFRGVPLSYAAIRRGNDMVSRCGLRECDNHEHRGCLLMRWSSWPLYSVSAWRPDRGEAQGSSEYFSVASHLETPTHSVDELMMSS
ncbi:hypothetical protein ACP70R_020101 [Stipagrostis hirtigluma subsp. patula]